MGLGNSSEAQIKEYGNLTGERTMTIQYCGGWGYQKDANEVMKRIDASHPGMFKYVFNKDAGTTGNFNVWIQKGGNG